MDRSTRRQSAIAITVHAVADLSSCSSGALCENARPRSTLWRGITANYINGNVGAAQALGPANAPLPRDPRS
jgi:hypothetical protein